MQIKHIAGYRFISLNQLDILQQHFQTKTESLDLKGTVLLSLEGININLAGHSNAIEAFRVWLNCDARFVNMSFHETYASTDIYQRIKIKVKKEIITFRQPEIDAVTSRAPAITPAALKSWLDEGRDITLLDTRNEYEIKFGTFRNAVNLHISDFGELPAATKNLNRNKPVVMFCTGGIRCEKASLLMQQQGFQEVYQLDKGILGYFADIGNAHYDGSCFVFDERVAIKPDLEPAV